jgi:tetratricopeptide (TPR) repeat protein
MTAETTAESSGSRRRVALGVVALGALALGGWAMFAPSDLDEHHAQLRLAHGHMREWSLEETSDARGGGRKLGPARLWRREGLNVLYLTGDRYEMAYQHGRLLHDEIADGAIPATLAMFRRMVANSYGDVPLAVPLAGTVYERFLMDGMAERRDFSRPSVAAALADGLGMSDATQIPFRQLARALVMPEALQLLGGRLLKDGGQKVLLLPPVGACSSFAAFGPWTKDGAMLIGRNMDFPLNGAYDKHPTVIYFEPTDGGQRFMTFVSSGVHNQGLTVYNEAGLFLSIHTVMTRDVGRGDGAVPVFMLGAEAARRARTFDEAVKILSAAPPFAGWSYMVVSSKERRTGVVDLDHLGASVRETTGEARIAQTNHHLTSEKRERNLFINRGIAEDNDGRYIRLMQQLDARRGALDARGAMRMMGDHVDAVAGGVTRGVGAIVGTHVTMTSVVVEPDAGRAWMARGPGPVTHNAFVSVPLVGTVTPDELGDAAYTVEVTDDFRRAEPQLAAAVDAFLDAKLAWENDNDSARALAGLEKAAALDPEEAGYQFQAAVFALRLGQVERATEMLAQALERKKASAHLRLLTHYYRGRALAALGKRDDAARELALVAKDAGADAKLRGSAAEALTEVEGGGQPALRDASLHPMLQQTDMMEY